MEEFAGEEIQGVDGGEGEGETTGSEGGKEVSENASEEKGVKGSTADYFDDEDEDQEGKDEGDVKAKGDEEDEEVSEDEIEALAEKEVEEELTDKRINFAELKKEYPDLLKKYPELKDTIHRDQAMMRMFGSVEDAKDASEKAQAYDFLDEQLGSGNTDVLVNAMSDKQLGNFSKNVLFSLARKSPQHLLTATRPLILNALHSMTKKAGNYPEGSKERNNLIGAARIFHEFLYGSRDIAPLTEEKKDPEIERKEQELSQREREIASARENEFRDIRNRVASERLSSAISARLPKDMAEGIKSAVVKDIISAIGEDLESDESHMANMKAMQKKAEKLGFPRNLIAQQVNAYLGRARNRIEFHVRKYRSDGGSSTSKNGVQLNDKNKSIVRDVPVGSSSSGKGSKVDPKKALKNMTTADFFAKE